MNTQKQLIGAITVYVIYVILILASNIFMEISVSENNETYEMISGILFGFIAIPIISIIIPFWLGKKWHLTHSFWPQKKDLVLILFVLFVFTYIVNFEAIKSLLQAGISLKTFAIHFFSIMLFHTTYYPLFVVLLFPVLRKTIGLKPSIIVTALAFSFYHLAQFHFYPAGTTFTVQLFLFCYFVASLQLYLFSESLVLVAIVHQITGALAVAANGSVHSEMDFLFFLTIPIITFFFGYMIFYSFKQKPYNKNFWMEIKGR